MLEHIREHASHRGSADDHFWGDPVGGYACSLGVKPTPQLLALTVAPLQTEASTTAVASCRTTTDTAGPDLRSARNAGVRPLPGLPTGSAGRYRSPNSGRAGGVAAVGVIRWCTPHRPTPALPSSRASRSRRRLPAARDRGPLAAGGIPPPQRWFADASGRSGSTVRKLSVSRRPNLGHRLAAARL